jgi:membrane-associated phospholipid phosphatase
VKRRTAYYPLRHSADADVVRQFFTAALLPVAPPRSSGLFGEALGVVDIGGEVTLETGIGVISWAYQNISGNPVAAFPSLHAAYPILAFFFLRQRWLRWSWLMLAYAAVVWFAIMDLGHHYLIDALGGVYAIASYQILRAVGGRMRLPSLTMPVLAPQRADARPPEVVVASESQLPDN